MREILFKAKRFDTGEWIEGYLVQQKNNLGGIHTCIFQNFEEENRWEMKRVDSNTVCQYTGLTDKYDKKIFEGDIVQDAEWEFEGYDPEVKGVVRFMTGTFDSGIYEYNGWVVEEKDKNIDHTPLLQYKKREKWGNVGFEIIGNIFDHQELI